MNYSGCFIYSPYYIAKGTQHISYYFAKNFCSYKLDNFVRMYRTSWHISTKPFWFLRFPRWKKIGIKLVSTYLLCCCCFEKRNASGSNLDILLWGIERKHQLPKGFNSMGWAYIFFFYLSECPFFFRFFKFTFLFVMMEKFPFAIVWDSLYKAHSIKDI